ncbi:hypothetical protein K0B04_04595, partial [Patescibacteria group bacterium]|nr:hypothetical protein [Patescibacteria group bacterium]
KKRYEKQKVNKDRLKSSKLLLYILLPIFVSYIVFSVIYNINKSKNIEIMRLENELKKLKNINDSQGTTSEPIKSQFVETGGKPEVRYQVQDTDPTITCKNDKCGNREMRRSLCDTYTCCEIGDEWKWVESQTLCYQMQKDYREMKEKQEEEKAKEDAAKTYTYSDCFDGVAVLYERCLEDCKLYWGDGYLSDISKCESSCLARKVENREECNKYLD